jgi:uncharacterized protein involved in exopolysaccharide biosynthesis
MRYAMEGEWVNERETQPTPVHEGASVKQLLHALFKRKWLILAIAAACVAAVNVVLLLYVKPTFVSTSQILVNPGREHIADLSLQSAGAIPPSVRFNEEQEAARTVELLTGRFLAERAVRRLGADVLYPDLKREYGLPPHRDVPPPPGADAERLVEVAIDRFQQDVVAEASPRSSIVTLGFRHRDPRIAANAANVLGDLFLERYLGMHQNPRTTAFFQEEFGKVKQRLRDSEQKLLAFKQANGINSSVSDEQSLVRQMQTGLRAALTETRSKQAELQSRNAELQKQMAERGTLYGNLQAEVIRNGAELNALRAREDTLTAKTGQMQARLDSLERLRDDYSYLEKQVKADEDNCRVPDEWLLGGRHAILVGREVLRGLLADLNSRGTTC